MLSNDPHVLRVTDFLATSLWLNHYKGSLTWLSSVRCLDWMFHREMTLKVLHYLHLMELFGRWHSLSLTQSLFCCESESRKACPHCQHWLQRQLYLWPNKHPHWPTAREGSTVSPLSINGFNGFWNAVSISILHCITLKVPQYYTHFISLSYCYTTCMLLF